MQTKTSLTGNYVSHPSSVIYDDTIIGDGVYIGANCTIGSIAESKKYFYNPPSFKVIIGKETVIHGNVTIDAGTVSNTEIGNKVWLMKGCHIGHDVVVEDNVTISPHVCLGGHVVVGEGTNIGMGAIVHQRVTIPKGCMIGMGTVVTKKTKMREGYVYAGNPARELRKNIR